MGEGGGKALAALKASGASGRAGVVKGEGVSRDTHARLASFACDKASIYVVIQHFERTTARMSSSEKKGHVVDVDRLPPRYPTHSHTGEFWEALGRTVATFGFLEETLAKAIFSFTATRPYEDDEIAEAFAKWIPKLERALSDQLGGLINTYQKSVRDHPEGDIEGFEELIADLRNASVIRNVLCHGSWRAPDEQGRSRPFFVNRQGLVFADNIDIPYLHNLQRSVTILISSVISTVTAMGWQFPSTNGPGEPIVSRKS